MRWFDDGFDPIGEFVSQWNQKVRRLRWSCIGLGILMVLAGILCLLFPNGLFLALQWIAAFGFVLYGIYHIVAYFCMPYYFRDPLLLILGILCLLSGVMLCGMPLYVTVTTLTFLLGMFLLLAGAEKLSRARHLRYFQLMNTMPITVSGVANIVMACLFLLLPSASAVALNTLLAVYLIASGIAQIVEAISMRKLHR